MLVVCTANICRSPMTAALLAARVAVAGEPVEISSAGLLPGGRPVPPEVLVVMGERGMDLSGHVSRRLERPMLSADLVIGMEHRHVRECVVLDGSAWPRTFTLRELVGRGESMGPGGSRDHGEPVASWLERLHAGRDRAALARPSSDADVADPYGGPLDGYRATAAELADLVDRLARLAWPATGRGPAAPATGRGPGGSGAPDP
ncbi:MAG: hypothetical protein M0007_08970, partial [Actinomycetota bacterium]|nr:hypothetical protein [Actinomycetota bacterium]